jgi:ribosome-binding factor A
MLRVNQVLRQVLAEAVERLRDGDERFERLTITDVDVSGDLSMATVYFDDLTAQQRAALDERRGYLQQVVAREVTLKRTPKLKFLVDPSIATGARIDELLRKATEELDE